MGDRRLIVVPVLGIVLSACGFSSSGHEASGRSPSGHPSSGDEVVPACCVPPQDAKVTGVLLGVGGPVRTAAQHWPGTIRVRGAGFTTIRTDSRGHFSAELAAGTYRFTATSPSYDAGKGECRAQGPVRLRAHHTTHVLVVCQMK